MESPASTTGGATVGRPASAAVSWFLGQAHMKRCSKYLRPSALVAALTVLRYMFTHTPLVRNRYAPDSSMMSCIRT